MLVRRPTVERLLEQMKGKRFVYQDKPLTLISYEFTGSDLKIVTSERLFFEPWADLLTILQNEFIPSKSTTKKMKASASPLQADKPTTTFPQPPVDIVTDKVISESSDVQEALTLPKMVAESTVEPSSPATLNASISTLALFPRLSEILMQNIEAVKVDKNYVEQAQQVSLGARMLVDMAKTEIEAVRTIAEVGRLSATK